MLLHLKVRYAALIAVDEFHKRLSEDYMPLLPETIPFLAELMEGKLNLSSWINNV